MADNQVFSLWVNENLYEFPAGTLSRVSKKCAALLKADDYQGKITHTVSDEALDAFLNACNLKPFKVTFNNAFELLDLADEWGIPSLQTFVSKYIKDKGIQRRDAGDVLGNLILYMNEETKNPQIIKEPEHNLTMRHCIEDVSRLFNQCLTDERFSDIHPELLFKIMMATDPSTINQHLLIDFVMKLLETDPEKAVPLCLRIDFDLLTEEQMEEIFQCREIHEQAMGYFIADSMSAIRNKEDDDIEQNEEKYQDAMQALKDDIASEKTRLISQLQSEYDTDIAQLEEMAQKQAQQLEYLQKLKEEQVQALQDEEDRYDQEVRKIERQLHNLKGITEERQAAISERQDMVRSQVKIGGQPVVDNTNKQIAELGDNDLQRRNKMLATLNPMIERAQKQYNTESGRVEEVTQQLSSMSNNISGSFATLAAKVVNDQFRTNYFLRDIQNKFQLFDTDPKIWDLSGQQVEEAEKIVKRLESDVSQQCPINVHHQIFESNENVESANQE